MVITKIRGEADSIFCETTGGISTIVYDWSGNYIKDQGLIVRKFEKDHQNLLQYEFIRAFPLAINSMPVSYDASSLLKCTVSLSYIRYVVRDLHKILAYPSTPKKQSEINSNIFGIGFDDIA